MSRILLGSPLLLGACASPADVESLHATEQAKYQTDLASAQEWNTHVLGIPASGWLAIILAGSALTFILLICAGTWVYHVQQRRAEERTNARRGENEVRKAIASKPTCGMCGFTLTSKEIEEEVEREVRRNA